MKTNTEETILLHLSAIKGPQACILLHTIIEKSNLLTYFCVPLPLDFMFYIVRDHF
jgi:hypothetical protein